MRKELSSLLANLLNRNDSHKESVTDDIDLLNQLPKADIDYNHLLSSEQLEILSGIVGYTINYPGVYERAFTHRSFLQVRSDLKLESNERLEFLGDAVLDMIVSDYLFSNHHKLPEGTLSKLRSNIVNKDTLIDCAIKLSLDSMLIISYGAKAALDKGSKGILANALEALIAAIYLDKGYRQVEEFVLSKIIPLASGYMNRVGTNYKSRLQELLQADSQPAPVYNVLEKKGPDHRKNFTVQAYVGDKPLGIGTGENKQKAEQNAARNSLNLIQKGTGK